MSEKTSVLLSDVTIKGNVIEKEKLMTDAKIEGDVSAEVLQTFEGSNIKGSINNHKIIDVVILFSPFNRNQCYVLYNSLVWL